MTETTECQKYCVNSLNMASNVNLVRNDIVIFGTIKHRSIIMSNE